MNKLAYTLVTLFAAPLALAGQPVKESVDISNPQTLRVSIEHMNGEADIIPWDQDRVEVTGEISDRAEEFIIEKRGNEVIIKVEMPSRHNWNWGDDDGDDLEIRMPAVSNVEYESINADVTIASIQGDVSLNTVNGDMRVSELPGRVRLESVNGNINTRGLSGDIRIETVNGDIRERDNRASEVRYTLVNGDIDVETLATRVKVESVNGDMELRLSQVERLAIATVGGDADVQLSLAERATVEGNSVNGDIKLRFTNDVDARFSLQGHAGGDLRNRVTDDKMQKAKYGPGRWLEFTTQSGSALVELSTVSGELEVSKQ